LDGKLYLFDAATLLSRTIKIVKHPEVAIGHLIDYDQFCNPAPAKPLPSVTVKELAEWRQRGLPHQLIDVREPYEYEIANLGGRLIPMAELPARSSELSKETPLVLHCRSGQRSARAVRQLQEAGFQDLYNLEGGILAWAEAIDPQMTIY
jgi:adenylyltransferase/sulfurtransferase